MDHPSPHPAPAVTGINHVTLCVADLERSVAFYEHGLGAALRHRWDRGAYLEVGTLWLCLELADRVSPRDDDSHIAFGCRDAEFDAAAARLTALAPEWKENRSEGRSVYVLDPDGHKLELHMGDLASRLAAYAAAR
ncbi:glutathione transferase [Rhodobacteraceae bacterium CCMM004]|nr:glutathione transferase [Rhodobacteraceae bacterium CCMM004]